ncbi:hypothetical protein J3F83DRAFT_755329 [Trichoderma novae-zelandiae]
MTRRRYGNRRREAFGLRESAVCIFSVTERVGRIGSVCGHYLLGLKGVEEERERMQGLGERSRKWIALRFCCTGSSGNKKGRKLLGDGSTRYERRTGRGKEWGPRHGPLCWAIWRRREKKMARRAGGQAGSDRDWGWKK